MTQQIDVPGVGIVEFPDSMTDEQITSAIQNNIIPNYKNQTPAPAAAPAPVNNSQYNAPVSTFLANAINSATFGLPDYLNKTFTPETYAEGQRYQAANPMAANLGTATGEVAGYALPAGYGAVKGAQLGLRGAEALAGRFAPNLANLGKLADYAKLYGKSQAALTGATMGAQAGAALPGVLQGDPGRAVAAPELINQYANKLPAINHLGPVAGNIVPAVAGGAASIAQNMKDRMRMIMQYEAAKKVLGQ